LRKKLKDIAKHSLFLQQSCNSYVRVTSSKKGFCLTVPRIQQSTKNCTLQFRVSNTDYLTHITNALTISFHCSSTFWQRRAACRSRSGSWRSSTRSSSRYGSRRTWGSRSTRRCRPARYPFRETPFRTKPFVQKLDVLENF
jgi:hypothetical protein